MVSNEDVLAQLPAYRISDILANLELLQQAVQQFDVRFVLRALRAISTIRKPLNKDGDGLEILKTVRQSRETEQAKSASSGKKGRSEGMLPEEEVYIAILRQVCCPVPNVT